MSKSRMTALAAIAAFTLLLVGGAGTAAAQGRAPLTQKVAVTGVNKGKNFKGTYTIQRFTTSGGKLVAVGRLTGTLKNRRVSRNNVRMPASFTQAAPARSSQIPPAPLPVPSCPVLHLDLGPLNLNLLGLVVRTNRILIFIDGIASPNAGGGLLGSIVCALSTVVLPPTPVTPAAQALSALTALAPRG
jgi:hypothetical protein